MTMLHALAALMPRGTILTQKGYGHVYGASSTANLALSYANVDGGSAPAAGDLVVWIAYAFDTGSTPMVDLTGAGWAQQRSYVSTLLGASVLAKTVIATDISSPPNVVVSPTVGSVGFWVAYSVSQAVGSLAVSSLSVQYSGNFSPTDQLCDSSGIAPGAVSITVAGGGGSDDSPSTAFSGATADISLTSSNNIFGNTAETKFLAVRMSRGANITVSKGSDGDSNHLVSAYVTVT